MKHFTLRLSGPHGSPAESRSIASTSDSARPDSFVWRTASINAKAWGLATNSEIVRYQIEDEYGNFYGKTTVRVGSATGVAEEDAYRSLADASQRFLDAGLPDLSSKVRNFISSLSCTDIHPTTEALT